MLNALPDSQWTRRRADHLLFRASFGGSPAEREAFFQLGAGQGVAVAVDAIANVSEDWLAFPEPAWAANYGNGDNLPYRFRETQFVGWFLNQMRSASPLAAKMFKFYVDHFPVDYGTFPGGAEHLFLFKHFRVLRDHALGNFGDLVRAVSWSEAMMAMLNLDQSRRGEINENFGRELLELFTLGVDGGYTELDVNTVAAAFTGRMLRYNPPYDLHLYEGFLSTSVGYWDAAAHIYYPNQYSHIDMTPKVIFGDPNPVPALVLNQAPFEQGDEVINRILARPQCAYHLCWKLWRYFVEPDPDQALVLELAIRLMGYNYELRPLLRDIFLSEEFYAAGAIGNQIKDPIDVIITATKALEAPMMGNSTLDKALEEMGYIVYRPPNIAGWPEPEHNGNLWLSTGAMMFRLNLPAVWTHGEIGVFQRTWEIPDEDAGSPWEPEYPFPEFLDLDLVAPKQFRGPENLDLLLEQLAARLLPFHPLRPQQKRALLYHYTRTRSGADERSVIREIIRQILSLPESQMQ